MLDEAEHNIIQLLHTPLQETLSLSELQDASAANPTLFLGASYTRNGWPNNVPDKLSAYLRVCKQLACWNISCVARGLCAVVPSVLRAHVLDMAHEGHLGIVRLKQRCRDLVWWPGIDIETLRPWSETAQPAFSVARPGPQPRPHQCSPWTGRPRAGPGHRQYRQMLGVPSSAGGAENGGRKKKEKK